MNKKKMKEFLEDAVNKVNGSRFLVEFTDAGPRIEGKTTNFGALIAAGCLIGNMLNDPCPYMDMAATILFSAIAGSFDNMEIGKAYGMAFADELHKVAHSEKEE